MSPRRNANARPPRRGDNKPSARPHSKKYRRRLRKLRDLETKQGH